MTMKDMTVTEFAALTGSAAPAPGGGSIAALAASFSAALTEMVANLTVGKAKYTEVEPEMSSLIELCGTLRKELLDDIDRDCTSFNAFMAALALPKDTDEQKAARTAAMQNALKEAAAVPFEIAEKAARILPHAEAVVLRGNASAVSDGLVSAMLARTAVRSALLNVKINLQSIKDEAYVADMREKCRALEQYAIDSEEKILALCPELM